MPRSFVRTSLPGKREAPSCTCQSLSRGVSPPPLVPASSGEENWEGGRLLLQPKRDSLAGLLSLCSTWLASHASLHEHSMTPTGGSAQNPRAHKSGSWAALQAGLASQGHQPAGGVVCVGEGRGRETRAPSRGQEGAPCSNLGKRGQKQDRWLFSLGRKQAKIIRSCQLIVPVFCGDLSQHNLRQQRTKTKAGLSGTGRGPVGDVVLGVHRHKHLVDMSRLVSRHRTKTRPPGGGRGGWAGSKRTAWPWTEGGGSLQSGEAPRNHRLRFGL